MDKPEVQITDVQTKSAGLEYRIYPTQHIMEGETPDTRKFIIDEAEYSSREIKKIPFVGVSEAVTVSGVRGVCITIYPFQYNPADNNLLIRTAGRFTIKTGKPIDVNVAYTESMDGYLNAFFVNYGDCRNEVTGLNTALGITTQYHFRHDKYRYKEHCKPHRKFHAYTQSCKYAIV
jgi:hypothetical protein